MRFCTLDSSDEGAMDRRISGWALDGMIECWKGDEMRRGGFGWSVFVNVFGQVLVKWRPHLLMKSSNLSYCVSS